MTSNFDYAVLYWDRFQVASLDFGRFALQAVRDEGRTIRELSIAICGNEHLEDKIGRYIQAAEWDHLIRNHIVYKEIYPDMCDWLTTSHMTELWRMYATAPSGDKAEVFDLFEQLFIRNARKEITEVRSVEWLRAKRQGKSKSYLDKVKSYYSRITFDLIETPFDGLNSRQQLNAAADVRENAKRLQESLQTLLDLIELESETT